MEKRPLPPQFRRLNPESEENPPPRFLWCPEYRRCLAEAAYRNLSLDCGACSTQAAAVAACAAGAP